MTFFRAMVWWWNKGCMIWLKNGLKIWNENKNSGRERARISIRQTTKSKRQKTKQIAHTIFRMTVYNMVW